MERTALEDFNGPMVQLFVHVITSATEMIEDLTKEQDIPFGEISQMRSMNAVLDQASEFLAQSLDPENANHSFVTPLMVSAMKELITKRVQVKFK